MILLIFSVSLGGIILTGAITALVAKKIETAIIAAGIVSLLASVLYLLLAAPDVGMTEAAIGSGLTTFLFFYVLNKIKGKHD
jgi:uncharacterized MnhB-related membrane protein